MANRKITYCDECDIWDDEEFEKNGIFRCPNLNINVTDRDFAETTDSRCEHYEEEEE